MGDERPVLQHFLARQPLGNILAVDLVHGAAVLLADHQLALPHFKARLQLEHIGAQRRHAAAAPAFPHIFQRVQHKAGVAEGRQPAQLPRDVFGSHALIPELGALQRQQAAAGGELAAVHHMDALLCPQLGHGHQRILAGAGEVGADVDVDYVKALGKNFFKKSAKLLGADRRRLGEDTLLAVLGVEIRRGVAAVVGENPLPALDGQGYGADAEALQQRRRQVAGAVVCNANGSVHVATPPIIYIITMGSIKGKAQMNL